MPNHLIRMLTLPRYLPRYETCYMLYHLTKVDQRAPFAMLANALRTYDASVVMTCRPFASDPIAWSVVRPISVIDLRSLS